MQKVNKLACATVFMLCMNSYAQTPPTTTLNQAIEVVKARKTAELNFTTQVYSNAPKPLANAIPAQKNNTDTSLKLWSIRGLGRDLRAEVIYQGQIKEVSFAAENIRVGNWFLVGLTEHEAQFSVLNKNGKLSQNQIHLKLPSRSELATLWPNPLLEGVNLTDGSMRPPVPMSLLKP
jgi:hypothetical protein